MRILSVQVAHENGWPRGAAEEIPKLPQLRISQLAPLRVGHDDIYRLLANLHPSTDHRAVGALSARTHRPASPSQNRKAAQQSVAEARDEPALLARSKNGSHRQLSAHLRSLTATPERPG